MRAVLQEVITEEVTMTLSGFHEMRPYVSLAHAISAYAEQLSEFVLDDIRAGFRTARAHARILAPTPTQVRACVVEVWRARQELPPDDRETVLGEFPPALREFYEKKLDAPPVQAGAEDR